jgi:hypothetical protein
MLSSTRFLNDGSAEAPKLKVFMNLDTLVDLRADTTWSGHEGAQGFERLLEDGFEGVQLTPNASFPAGAEIPHCGLDRINTAAEGDAIAAKHADRGDLCITVHAGWGLEDDDEAFHIVEAILRASEKYKLAIFVETHRATLTQDIWRTVQITKRLPEIRFNGDFSHYYCGQELVYGDWNEKLEFLEPIFRRVGFLHGRIASSGCMQVPVNADLQERPLQAHGVANYLDHFRQLWTRAMSGFLSQAQPGDVLIFAPELLAATYYYARKFPNAFGRMEEESDRYAQALLYKELAKACFAEAVEAQGQADSGDSSGR